MVQMENFRMFCIAMILFVCAVALCTYVTIPYDEEASEIEDTTKEKVHDEKIKTLIVRIYDVDFSGDNAILVLENNNMLVINNKDAKDFIWCLGALHKITVKETKKFWLDHKVDITRVEIIEDSRIEIPPPKLVYKNRPKRNMSELVEYKENVDKMSNIRGMNIIGSGINE